MLSGLDLAPRGQAARGGNGAQTSGVTRIAYFDDSGTEHEVPQGIQPLGAGYTVNLQDVSVEAAAESLFGQVLKVPYTVDPGVSGTVTLATGGAVSRDALVGLFEEALSANGLSLTEASGSYRILAGSGDGTTARLSADGYGLTAVPLRRVPADRMLSLLDGFAAPEGTLRAAPDGDMILVRGSSTQRADLAALIASLDTDVMSSSASGIAFLQTASAASVAEDLRALQESDPSTSTWKVIVLDRSNALILRAASSEDLGNAMRWVQRLDQTGGTGGTDIEVYQVQFARASSLASVLTETFGGSGGGSAPAAAPAPATPDTADAGGDVALAAAAAPSALGMGSATGTDVHFIANDADNTLIIRAPAPIRHQALALLAAIDKSPTQVLIDVILVEVTLNDATSMGVQAYLKDKQASLIASTDSAPALTGNLPGVNIILGRSADPRAIIDSLSKVTDVKVVSAPSISAFENEQAEIKVVEQVPIVTQQVQATTDPNAPTVNSVEYRDAGVILRVTPQVSQTDLVNLSVKQELSAVVGQTDGNTTLTPTLRQRSIATRVAVYDGQTVALGGLISTQSSRSKDGDALTKLLGGHRTSDRARSELVIFITPHVIRDQQDAAAAAQEIRRKMTLMAGK
ncbi:secretin N-terminal domain-containing protein [Paragemmobacter straminiformis]|uniref:Type II secretion system protein GspD n=1 Tax=Paragemmobacter straminiformis TaxID=2045119 RepID=A0A842IA77_9RHOB|nr:secretin N-terminal domain-containing protein [Gemmobacter straminiformis]MBC2836545.1 hypothetical protein [Gemmobacter straminiformis]